MSEQQLRDSDLLAVYSGVEIATTHEVLSMAAELLHLRAVVANAVELINSGRCGLGHEVLKTRVLNNE